MKNNPPNFPCSNSQKSRVQKLEGGMLCFFLEPARSVPLLGKKTLFRKTRKCGTKRSSKITALSPVMYHTAKLSRSKTRVQEGSRHETHPASGAQHDLSGLRASSPSLSLCGPSPLQQPRSPLFADNADAAPLSATAWPLLPPPPLHPPPSVPAATAAPPAPAPPSFPSSSRRWASSRVL